MCLVSVVIPVFNAQSFLDECLTSILDQVHVNLEILCVDDASQDDSLRILETYAQKDRRVKVFHHESNRGEAAARNSALVAATGTYIGFVDADDSIEQNFFSDLCRNAQTTNADISKGIAHYANPWAIEAQIAINDAVKRDKFNFASHFWTAIYRRAMLIDNSIVFPVGVVVGADLQFLVQAVTAAKGVATVDTARYLYRYNAASMSNYITASRAEAACMSHAYVAARLTELQPSEISLEAYVDNIFLHLYNVIFITSKLQYDAEETLARLAHKAAETIYTIWTKCRAQDAINAKLAQEYVAVFDLLQQHDLEKLTSFLMRSRSPQAMLAANFRLRAQKRM